MKCEQYWPDDGSLRQYGDISVTTISESVYAEFVVRELSVVKVYLHNAASSETYQTYELN